MQAAAANDMAVGRSAALDESLQRAHKLAVAQGHGTVALEHLLFALTDDPEAVALLSASRTQVDRLRADTSGYLGQMTHALAGAPGKAPMPGADLLRILQLAGLAARQSQRRQIDSAIVLAAIIGDGNSPAAGMLKAQGLTFEEVIRVIQQATPPAVAAAPAPAPLPPPRAPGPAAVPVAPAAAAAPQARPLTSDAEAFIASARARVKQVEPPPMASRPAHVRTPPPTSLDPPTDPLTAPPAPPAAPPPMAEPPQAEALATFRPPGTGRAMPPPLSPPPPPAAPVAAPPMAAPPPLAQAHIAPSSPPDAGRAAPQREFAAPDPVPMAPPPMPAMPPPLPPAMTQPPQPPPVQRPALPPAPSPPPVPPMMAPAMAPVMQSPPQMSGQAAMPILLPRDSLNIVAAAAGLPAIVRIGEPVLVEIRVPRSEVDVPRATARPGVAPMSEPPVYRVITARLAANTTAIAIEPRTPETVWLEPTLGQVADDVSWQFLLTPQRRGTIPVSLTISGRSISAYGVMADKTAPSETFAVTVKRAPGALTKRFLKTLALLGFGGVMTWAVLGPLAGPIQRLWAAALG